MPKLSSMQAPPRMLFMAHQLHMFVPMHALAPRALRKSSSEVSKGRDVIGSVIGAATLNESSILGSERLGSMSHDCYRIPCLDRIIACST